MVFAELVNGAGVDGTSQKLIHLVLGVQSLLSAPASGAETVGREREKEGMKKKDEMEDKT